MNTSELSPVLATLFSELVDGTTDSGGPFILNSGDIGLLRSVDRLSASDASGSVNDGATIAAHVQHLSYGLSLMNRWATDGDDAFADPKWDDAWNTSVVDTAQWEQIRRELRDESYRWRQVLNSPRQRTHVELSGMIGSIAHLAYHLGAIRQISKQSRGPKEGTFSK